jgi:hypothetical protein
MASPTKNNNTVSGGSQQAPTDLALLWRRAANAYNDKVGKEGMKLNVDGTGLVTSLEGVQAAVDSTSEAFRNWRHPKENKLVKVRTIIGENLANVQAIGDQVISSATAAFPPAGAIWTVVTYAIKACQAMSRDYNQLMALIGEAGTFIKTLQIIESRVPDRTPYIDCIVDALTALMMVFAIQTRFMYDRRALQFWHSLTTGADSELKKAYDDVTNAINQLGRANGFQAVRNTEEIKGLVTRNGGKIDDYYESMMNQFLSQSRMTEDGFHRQDQTMQAGFHRLSSEALRSERERKSAEQGLHCPVQHRVTTTRRLTSSRARAGEFPYVAVQCSI